MASQGLQITGVLLAIIGWLGTIITCAIPMWKVTAFIGSNIVTLQTSWEGIWMSCMVQSTGQMDCRAYDSVLFLPHDLQAARAMVVITVIVGLFGVLMAVLGGKCTNCIKDEVAKAKARFASGVIFILAALLIIIPVSWSANVVIRDFNNPLLYMTQKELGAAIYLGWGSSGLLLLGGGLLCKSCPPKDDRPYVHAKFIPSETVSSTVNYVSV